MGQMVGSGAFSQALTNPLLAANAFGPETFTPLGLQQIKDTKSFADVVRRNLAKGSCEPLVTFTRQSSAPH